MTEDERPEPPLAGSEEETLLGFLEFLRATIERKTAGLDAAQLDRALAPSTMTLGGMLTHLAFVEDWWFTCVLRGESPTPPFADIDWDADPDWDWHTAAERDPDDVHTLWRDFVERSRAVTAATAAGPDGLGALAERARPSSGERVSLRWILVHMIEEYARHAGHADLLRESIDGQVGE